METGHLPTAMDKVLIRMIPKRVNSTKIIDFWPVLMIKTSVRIISQAVNRKKFRATDTLIDSEPKGFMPSRQMDDNISNFKELVDNATKHAKTIPNSNDQIGL